MVQPAFSCGERRRQRGELGSFVAFGASAGEERDDPNGDDRNGNENERVSGSRLAWTEQDNIRLRKVMNCKGHETLDIVQGVIKIFGPQYLPRPTAQAIQRQMKTGEAHGFPGMIGSLDCMHWERKNCPDGWQGQFTHGDHTKSTFSLRTYGYGMHFFGVAGSNNDINVLNQSLLFTDVLQGRAPPVHFSVNERQYDMESARKDIKRAFGALQSRFAILRYAARYWHRSTLSDIIYACIILHDMIMKETHARAGNYDLNYDQERYHSIPEAEYQQGPIDGFNNLLLQN
ncbi:LOW QUALITY PROTEIN: hypothetical protein U9M48_024886 [Paspalum notatum var. saurae]|uniref:DDE Tnp4 domain-containing protein n=1 Tax=Paspalum notatum var. saurae TaxID=547442 RepID=A0AAQ3WWG2_PASNO